MADGTIIATLYIVAMICMLLTIIFGGLLVYFRKAVFNRLKLTKLMKQGYIICRLKKLDKTEDEIVVKPDPETNGVRFPRVEGLYTLDNASVILKERKYPVYEWREGETAPINHEKEVASIKVNCPHCSKDFVTQMYKPKSISPSVLDNLILKIKTLSAMIGINKYLLLCLIGIGVVAIGVGVTWFWVDDFKKRAGEIIAPPIIEACKAAAANLRCI